MANPIKPTIKTELLPLITIVLAALASFYFYAHFPPIVITHWDFNGQPNGWSPAWFAAFFMPMIIAAMYLLLIFVPLLDPKKERYFEFRRAYHIFKDSLVAFMVVIYFLASLNNLGLNAPIGFWVPLLVGLIFVIIGNYMGKLKSNWFIGMRNPWTLSNEEVWNKTNRLTGKLFILGGLGLVAISFLPTIFKLPLFILVMVALIVAPNIYSYLLFRKVSGK